MGGGYVVGVGVVMGIETVEVVAMGIGYVEGFGCVGSKRTNDTCFYFYDKPKTSTNYLTTTWPLLHVLLLPAVVVRKLASGAT
jgi:hypothetical protein